jgi:hypothetical protein
MLLRNKATLGLKVHQFSQPHLKAESFRNYVAVLCLNKCSNFFEHLLTFIISVLCRSHFD